MLIIPAIDLRNGNVVRLFQGNFDKETIFSSQPDEVAIRWQSYGAKFLHIVDLDGARIGKSTNIESIKSIVKAIQIPVELGGGIRTLVDIEKILAMGVNRVILGSAAVQSPVLVREACRLFNERIVVGIDARDGIVATDGWETSGKISAIDLAKKMKGFGIKRIVYTDISRDGTGEGVNISSALELAKATGLKVIVSGGVGNLDDIREIKKHEREGIEGVIIGKALYTNSLDLEAAINIAEKGC
ncbi:MAG: 1-(5-phosphoribosyl)-5-[Selenomonadaceae bacterium]|nr:1-(5-phosphoribosyl)-5-[(5-phosphoribosylamino)methylideneamino]imidazole-4-carboxamide isomerase [Selenomonadaceae bacterium]